MRRRPACLLPLVLLIGHAASWVVPAPSPAAPSRWLLPWTAEAERLVSDRGLEILERYGERRPGGSLLVRVPDAGSLKDGLASLPGPGRRVSDVIHLRARTIDTSVTSGSSASAISPLAATGGRLELIQFHGPVRREWVEQLESTQGITLISYIPDNAYLLWRDGYEALSAAALPLQWRGDYLSSDRLSPDLPAAQDPVNVTVQIARAGKHDAVVEEIRSLADSVLMEPRPAGPVTNFRVSLSLESIRQLSRTAEVVWIEPFGEIVWHDEKTALVIAGNLPATRPRQAGYLEWLKAHGLDSLEHVILDVTDTGIATGDPLTMPPGLVGRLAYSLDFSEEGSLQDCSGHGTSMAGIIAGAPDPGNQLVDPEGFMPGLGLIPSARLGATRIFRCNGSFFPGSFADLVASAYERGARIGNNSWGGVGPQYNSITAEYDALVRDANLDPADGDQGFLPVFSSGNFGPAHNSVGWPASAKNVLGVGASEGVRPGVTDGCGTEGVYSDNANDILPISSRGPTGDGRMKPDVVAPGSHIQSIASNAEDYSGSGVCDTYYPPGQTVLTWGSGTSQAAAHATGAAALAFEVHRRETGLDPSPAMLKAILINRAKDLGGTQTLPSNTIPRPNPDQGWGRLDLEAVLSSRAHVASDQEFILDATGQSRLFDPIVVEDPSKPVIVTLVWTDAPGTPAGWSWVNDLDLVVESPGGTYLGNVIQKGVSIPGGLPDARNNVENVYLPPGQTLLSIRVDAANIAGDGVPSVPGGTDQDFALFVNNARWPRRTGRVELPGAASCGDPLPLTVLDADLQGFGRVSVDLKAGADRETAILIEDPPASGNFRGAIDVTSGSPAPGDGRLQVDDLLSITATYIEADPDTGGLVPRTGSSTAHCVQPVISDLRVTRIGDEEARVTWKTDRPADSSVTFGPGGASSRTEIDAKLVRQHEMRLAGLQECTTYEFTVASRDAAGLVAEAPASPLSFSTGAGVAARRTVYYDDMESLGTNWTHGTAGASGSVDDWELGYPAVAPPGASSGGRVWATVLDGNYSEGSDSLLVSPPIDLRDAVGAELTFTHFYSISGGSSPFSFNDGAWVEITSNGGQTWSLISPVGGYPDTVDEDNPYLPQDATAYAGGNLQWSTARFDLSLYSGGIIQIRFHFWQDSEESNPRFEGWMIDDVRVTAQGGCHLGRLRIDSEEYGCSSRVLVTLHDSDLDINPAAADSVGVPALSSGDQVTVTLTETDLGSGEFTGELMLGASGPGVLDVVEGGQFSVTYSDQDTGDGTPAIATASALVPDCTPPPAPTDISARPDGAGGLVIEWTPPDAAAAPDLQGYRVFYDTDGPGPTYLGTGALQGASPVRREAVVPGMILDSLQSCIGHFITVTAFDRLGNESDFGLEALGVPSGPAPCSFGRILVDPPATRCDQALDIVVSDQNADPDPVSPGTLIVTATSPSQPGGLPVTLLETTASSGVFTGSLVVSQSAQPGKLQVSEGEVVEVEYLDGDDGSGQARVQMARSTVADCLGPVITNVRAGDLASDRATIRWDTDEPATTVLDYGTDPALGSTRADAALVTEHAVFITGLPSCAPVYFTVSSTDGMGNTASADDAGSPFSLGTFVDELVFSDDFESGAPGWSAQALRGANEEWELGTPQGNGASAPSGAFSGISAWGTDLDDRYDIGADIVLISPPIDLSGARSATLRFKHWYEIASRLTPTSADDGAFVEVSTDDGATWTYITPADLAGYPAIVTANPYTPAGAGAYAGSTGKWVDASFSLSAFADETIRVRFHLIQDESDFLGTRNGWFIDDVSVSLSIACHAGEIEFNRQEFGCGTATAGLRVTDADLDLNPLAPDQVSVEVASDSDPGGLPVVLLETGPATTVFEAAVELTSTASPGKLLVGSGDTVTASYVDSDDGTGNPRTVHASAQVTDCQPPVISSVAVTGLGLDSITVSWVTSEPATSFVLHGADPSLGSSVGDPSLTLTHSVTVTGLSDCDDLFFTVVSSDAVGNTTRDDTLSGVRLVRTPGQQVLLSERFESGAAGWTHSGTHDGWVTGVVPAIPPGSSRVATTSPGGSYSRPPGEIDADFILESPPVNLAGFSHPTLVFEHNYGFASSVRGGDGGWVEAWDGREWVRLTPDGGYPSFIDVEADPGRRRLGGYAGTSPPGFSTAVFDLSPALAGPSASIRIRFHVFIESGVGVTGSGWQIDDIRITGESTCGEGRLHFERDAVSCAANSAVISVSDLDLDVNPAAIDTAQVLVESSGGPAPLMITLTELLPTASALSGLAPLSPSGAAGTLRAAPGDQLTATYFDADDGNGGSGPVSASVPVVECPGPDIGSVALLSDGLNGLIARWSTDIPADGEVSFSPISGGSPMSRKDPRLVTSHELRVDGAVSCEGYTATISSRDRDGVLTTVTGPAEGLFIENVQRNILFADDMEGPDPGWTVSGSVVEWQRGQPAVGPPSAFSGQNVYATDLGGPYDGGTNATLSTPPIDLTNVTEARLTFWHWYDVFASDPPNSVDDSVWVQVDTPGNSPPVYIQPLGGYPDTSDVEAGEPLPLNTTVYSGTTDEWEKAVFDLTPFAGQIIRVQFRIWNDLVELLLNGITGAGWYIDDVEVSSPSFCFGPPSLAASLGDVTQGDVSTALSVQGNGFRPGATLSLGRGITVANVTVTSPGSIQFDMSVSDNASPGIRDLVIINPDGQTAATPGALRVLFRPSRADLNGSGRVDGNDLAILARAFGASEDMVSYRAAADLNGDGIVDGMDLSLLAAHFGSSF